MKLACADFSFPLLDHARSLDLIALLGFEGVDLGLFEGRAHLWPSRELASIARSAARLRRKLDDRGLVLADVYLQAAEDFASLAVDNPDPGARRRAREVFLRALEFTARCGGRHLSGLPGVRFRGEPPARSFALAAEELGWRVAQARAHGIAFSVEPHLGSLIPTPRLAARLLAMTPGLSLTLDYGHFTYQGIADREIQPLTAHASHVHARCGRPRRLQAPFKDNAIDFRRMVTALRRRGYAGWIGVEYVWIDWEHCDEVDNLSETILLRDHLLEVGA